MSNTKFLPRLYTVVYVFFAVMIAGCGNNDELDADIWTQSSENGVFEVTLDPQTDDAVEINEFLEWIVTIKTADGKPVSPARITVDGGMKMHGHGLPSQPQVSDYEGDGKYLLKGLMFSMKGKWSIDLVIQSESLNDKVSFQIKLGY